MSDPLVHGKNASEQWIDAPVEEFLTPLPNSKQIGVKRLVSFEVDHTDLTAQTAKYLGPTFPEGAVVYRAFYNVDETFTSATDAASIGIGFNTDASGGIVNAAAISAGGNIWDAGWHETIQDTGAVADFTTALTADRKVEFLRAGGENLTAGHLTLYVEYIVLS